jgi:hypothetical protein
LVSPLYSIAMISLSACDRQTQCEQKIGDDVCFCSNSFT